MNVTARTRLLFEAGPGSPWAARCGTPAALRRCPAPGVSSAAAEDHTRQEKAAVRSEAPAPRGAAAASPAAGPTLTPQGRVAGRRAPGYLPALHHVPGHRHLELQVGVVLGPGVVLTHGAVIAVGVPLELLLSPEREPEVRGSPARRARAPSCGPGRALPRSRLRPHPELQSRTLSGLREATGAEGCTGDPRAGARDGPASPPQAAVRPGPGNAGAENTGQSTERRAGDTSSPTPAACLARSVRKALRSPPAVTGGGDPSARPTAHARQPARHRRAQREGDVRNHATELAGADSRADGAVSTSTDERGRASAPSGDGPGAEGPASGSPADTPAGRTRPGPAHGDAHAAHPRRTPTPRSGPVGRMAAQDEGTLAAWARPAHLVP